jgi:hemoglobin-like flavoprotein
MNLELEKLETSFDLLAPRGEELAGLFYCKLFEAAPQLRPLFAKIDMKRQRAMLLAGLVLLRNSLRDLDALVPKLEAMGARHAVYGANPELYPLVGQALLASMAELAGDAWTSGVAEAWADAYDIVAAVMLAGAERPPQRAAA